MILTLEQISVLIDTPFNKKLIEDARKYYTKCVLHVTGEGMKSFLSQVKQYENDNQFALRKAYARSNKYLFNEMLRPLDKVFTSRGGAKYYNLEGNSEVDFKQTLSNVKDGMSLSKWMQTVWKKKRVIDPNGIIFMEISQDGNSCYPTYKGINSIYDYKFSGNQLDYVIFEPEKTKEGDKYRVVDDRNDYMVLVGTDARGVHSVSIITEETFPNYFGYVPGRLISDDFNDEEGIRLSIIDSVIELAEEIIIDNSVKIIFKNIHGFPGYWEVERRCISCGGSGKIDGKNCPSCSGVGLRMGRDISDKIIVTLDEAGKAGAIPPAGYVSTDVATWVQMNTEADLMEKLLHKAMWGTLAMISEKIYEKATGVVTDLQPVYDKLGLISSETETVEKFITDILGAFYHGGSYHGSTVIYGRRFQLESPDALLKKYSDAKTTGIPEEILENIYMEYLQTAYAEDSFEMAKQVKKFKLDPYPIYTASDLKNLGFVKEEIYRKVFYMQWISTIDLNTLLFSKEQALIEQRDNFIINQIKKYAKVQDDLQRTQAVGERT
jgi:hypothetical protein